MLEDNYQPSQNALVPIVRNQSSAILSAYNKNSGTLYNSLTPYTDYNSSIGPRQPFVYIKPSDSTLSRNLTKYDNQALPIGSTARDLQRIGQFLVTGNGILFTGKQLLLQRQNAFNETRIYNPLSVLKATAKPGSAGLIDYPIRHLETSGGLLNFFKDAVLSTIGFQVKDADKPTIDGTATGRNGESPYSPYTKTRGGARAGLLRLDTAKMASSIFESTWVTNPSQGGTNGGFLANLGNALLGKLKSLIPSTNPMGAFGGSSAESWEFRPEYKKGKDGVYYAFLADNSGFFTVSAPASQLFYNDTTFSTANAAQKSTVKIASSYHKYYPQKQTDASSAVWYANPSKVSADSVGVDTNGRKNNIKDLHKEMVKTINSFNNEANQFRRSAERYSEIKDYKDVSYPSYKNIMDVASGNTNNFEQSQELKNSITVDKMGFAKITVENSQQGYLNRDGSDKYNSLGVLSSRENYKLLNLYDPNQSADVIFLYFYDLINEKYIPFRATLSGVSDQHGADWEDITYLGRADRLFLYKGFSRDVNISFTVYANSAKELIPMWTRINYLTGLVRPSKYAGQAVSTSGTGSLGAESRFIYPPMITVRIGDLFVDQPCVISSIATSIPDDANWESYRADEEYKYMYNPSKDPIKMSAKTRQLPTKVDISISLKMLEKERAQTGNDLYGFNLPLSIG